MPNDADTRIIEMHFENRQFERNIAKSKKSLEDFKKELDFESTSKGLKKFFAGFESIDLHNLTSNIQRLTDKFTGLGDVSEFVVSRIRNGIESAAIQMESFIKSFTSAQILVGQSKYDAMNKAVQALIASGKHTEEQAYAMFDRVQKYTDQTSANFQVMADKLSEFTAVGRGLGESERALEGIYNMSSKAGKGAAEASVAMGVFSKAMGNGFLSLQHWQSLNGSAHIITADFRQSILDTAVATGDLVKKQNKYYTNGKKYGKQVEVIADSLENTLNKKWLSKDTMMAVFDKYFYAELDPEKSEKAMDILTRATEKGVLTYDDFNEISKESSAIAADLREKLIKAGVATGDLVIKNKKYYTNSKKYGKEVEVTANNIEQTLNTKWASKNTVGAILSDYKFAEVAYKSAQRALTFADAMNAIKESVSTGWMESFRIVFGDVTDAMELFTSLCERVIESLDKLKNARNAILRVSATGGGRQSLIDTILGDYGKDVETGAYGLLDLFDDVGKIIADGFWDMVKIFATGGEQLHWSDEGFKEAWLGLKLQEMSQSLRDFMSSIRDFFNEEVQIGDKTTTRLEMIKNAVDGFSAGMALGIIFVNEFARFMGELKKQMQPTIDAVTNFFSTLGSMLYDTANDAEKSKSVRSFFDSLLEVLKPINDAVNTVSSAFLDLLLTFIKWGNESGFFAAAMSFLTEAFKRVSTIVTRVAGPFIEFIGDMLDILKELFASNFDPKTISQLGNKIGKAFDKMMSKILNVESLAKLGEQLRDRFHEIFNNLIETIPEPVRNAFKDLFGLWGDDVAGENDSVFTRIRKFFESGFNGLFSVFTNLFSSFHKFDLNNLLETNFGFGTAYKFIAEVAGWFKGQNLYGLIMAFLGVATVWKIFRLVSNVKKLATNLQWAVGEVAESFKNGFKVRYDDYGEYLLKMAEGIAIFVGIVAILGSMKLSSIVQGIVAMGLIMGAIVLFNRAIKKEFSDGTLKDQLGMAARLMSLGFALSAMTAAVALLALALVPLGKLSFTGWLQAILGLVIILGALILFTKKLKDLKLEKTGLKGLTALAFAIGILVLSIVPFALMSWQAFARSLLGLAAVMTALILFSEKLKKLELKSVELAGLAALAAGIGILVLAIVPFAFMTWEAFARSLLGLAAVMVALILFSKKLKQLQISSVELAGLAALAAGIGILVLSIVPFALMTWQAFARSLLGLITVMYVLFIFAKSLKKLEIKSVALAGLAALAAGIGILVLSIVPFALMPWDAWGRSLLGLIVVLGSLLLFTYAIKKLNISSAEIAGLAALGVGIGIIALALTSFANMTQEGFNRAILGLIDVLASLLIFAFLLSKLDAASVKISGLIILTLAIAVLVKGLEPFAGMSPEGFNQVIFGLIDILAGLLIFSLAMKNVDVSAKNLVTMLGLVLVIVAISLALRGVKDIGWATILTFTVGLTAMMLGMAGAISILSAVPIGAGLKAILLISGGIAAIALVLSVVVPLLINSVGNSLVEFSAKLNLIATLVQDFSAKMKSTDDSGVDRGSMVLEKLKTMMSKLKGFGSYASLINDFSVALFDLGTGLESFANHTRNLPEPSSATSFKMIDTLLNYGEQLRNFSIGNLATEFYKLGVGLYAFDYLGNDMTTASESKPLQLIKELAGCAEDLRILSTVGLDKFKGQLAGLGGAMMLYAEGASEVTGIEGDPTSNAQGAVAILQAITQSLTNNGGFVIPDIPKEAELGSFGADLAALAGAIVKFSDASKGLGSNTSQAIMLLDFLGGDLKQKLTADNLKAATAFKDSGITPYGLAEFGLDIIALSTALKSFVDNTQGIDEGKIKSATDALGVFAAIRGQLIGQDAIIEVINWFTNSEISNNQLTQFGKDIEALGSALKSFATSVSWGEAEEGSFQKALDALTFLSDLKTRLPEIGGLKQLIVGRKENLSDLAVEITALGVALVDFSGRLVDENGESTINAAAISEALAVLDQIVGFLQSLSEKMPHVPGLIELIFKGHDYSAKDLTEGVDAFGDTCKELVKLTGILVDKDGNSKVVDRATLKAAISALDLIVGFMAQLPWKLNSIGGMINIIHDIIIGDNYNLEALRKDVHQFGLVCEELCKIAEILNGKDDEHKVPSESDITAATTAIDSITKFITTLSEKMPTIGGIFNIIKTGFGGKDYSLENLKTDLGTFAGVCEELGRFGQTLAGKEGEKKLVDPEQFDNATTVLGQVTKFITDLRGKMPTVGGLGNIFKTAFGGGDYSLDNLGDDLKKLGGGLSSFNDSLGSDFDPAKAGPAIEMAKGIADILAVFTGMGDKVFDAAHYMEGFESMLAVLTGSENTFGEKQSEGIGKAIVNLMATISHAMDEYGDINYDNISMFTMMAEGLKRLSEIDQSFNFEAVGKNIADGIAKGITDNQSTAMDAARKLASASYTAAMDQLQNDVLNGVVTIATVISQMLEEGTDLDPTITPVLDLTNMAAGIAIMREWMTNKGMTIDTTASSRLASDYVPDERASERTNQNDIDLSGIYSRMADLGTKITNLGTEVAKMKLVLDTGVVAGAIAPYVDEQIGRSQFYEERGN